MVDKIISGLAAIFALGLMVTIHEFGHFIAARFFKVRVDVFSFGFGPRIFGFKRGTVDYRVSILPLGGYVRMAGDNPSEERTGAPDEFLSKPRWQRTIIALAGPVMNLATAVVIFAVLFSASSQQPAYSEQPVLVTAVAPDSPAEKAGIFPGDRIVAIEGKQNPTWQRAHWEAAVSVPGTTLPLTIERDGKTFDTSVASSFDDFMMFGYPAEPATIGSVTPDSPAARVGIKPGDLILAANSQPVSSWYAFREIVQLQGERPVNLKIQRDDHSFSVVVRPQHGDGTPNSPAWQIGIIHDAEHYTITRKFNIIEATGFATWFSYRLGGQILGVLRELFSNQRSQVLKQMMGPIGIVAESQRAARRGWHDLLSIMAIISLNLGILNLLPIPILDGGHILMLGVEAVMRRDLSVRAKEVFLQVGMVFLLILFAIVMYHDIVRLLPHS